MKYSIKLISILSTLTLIPALSIGVGVVSASTSEGLIAQVNTSTQRSRRRLSWQVGVRPSRYLIGGTSRNSTCPSPAKIVAFVPPPNAEERISRLEAPVNLTLSSRPTFWVYVSSIPPKTEMQFTLQNAKGDQELYGTKFTVNQKTGLIGVRLPKTAPGLAIGENYYWELAMNCDTEDAPEKLISAAGWVQRINPQQMQPTPAFDPQPLVRKLAKASDLDKPFLYAGLGIWQDAVTALIELRQKQPDNQELKEDWLNLLIGAQLNQFVNTPVLAVN
jgi:hypothetical protein